MAARVLIGLVGDRNDTYVAHRAIPLAIGLAAAALDRDVGFEWVGSESVRDAAQLSRFNGLWCIPGSPYRSMDGVLLAIRYAREQRRPFLGTCGGFQHAVIEYARNVLGWTDAAHAETSPDAWRTVIAPLSCALVNVRADVLLFPRTKIATAYGSQRATEGYHCSYGVNPKFRAQLVNGPLRATAEDEAGDLRAVELDDHPFFVATLFQPERAALENRIPPLVKAFVAAAVA
jgi:CTP synthase (UTP-ammonia lyase)